MAIEDVLAIDQQIRRSARKIKPYHNRVHQEMVHHVLHAAELLGPQFLALLTVTNRWLRSHKETAESFDRARREIRHLLTIEWVRVVDQNCDGKEHVHAICAMDFDVAEGFDWEAQRELYSFDKLGRVLTFYESQRRRDLKQRVTTNILLVSVRRTLARVFAKHGFGTRLELNPVRNPIAAARYLAGRYCAGIRRRAPTDPRVRRLAYTDGFPKSPEPFVTRGQEVFRRKAERILGSVGVSWDERRHRFGSAWAWNVIQVVNELGKRYSPDLATWSEASIGEVAWKRLRPIDLSCSLVPASTESLLLQDLRANAIYGPTQAGDMSSEEGSEPEAAKPPTETNGTHAEAGGTDRRTGSPAKQRSCAAGPMPCSSASQWAPETAGQCASGSGTAFDADDLLDTSLPVAIRAAELKRRMYAEVNEPSNHLGGAEYSSNLLSIMNTDTIADSAIIPHETSDSQTAQIPHSDTASHEAKPASPDAAFLVLECPLGDLKSHPLNSQLYEENADEGLLESIRDHGILEPILVTSDRIIVSGHRRCAAAQKLGLKTVPIRITGIASPDALELLLLDSNLQRLKSNEEKLREFRQFLRLEQTAARLRQGRKAEQKPDLVVNLPRVGGGKSRDFAAAKVGMKSRTAENGLKVLEALEARKLESDQGFIDELRHLLNTQSIDAAFKRAVALEWIKSSAGSSSSTGKAAGRTTAISGSEHPLNLNASSSASISSCSFDEGASTAAVSIDGDKLANSEPNCNLTDELVQSVAAAPPAPAHAPPPDVYEQTREEVISTERVEDRIATIRAQNHSRPRELVLLDEAEEQVEQFTRLLCTTVNLAFIHRPTGRLLDCAKQALTWVGTELSVGGGHK